MRKLITLLLLITISPVLMAAHNFPPAIIYCYEKIGAAPGDDLGTIESIYEKKVKKLNEQINQLERTNSRNRVTTDGNIYSLNRGNSEQELKRLNDQKSILKKEIMKLDEAYQKVVSYFKKVFGSPSTIATQSHFKPHTDFWVNEDEAASPQQYLEINWSALDPKAKAAFKTIVPTEFEIEQEFPLNTKLSLSGNFYIGYNQLKIQLQQFNNTEYTFEQVDLFREIMLAQIYAQSAFNNADVLKATSLNNPNKRTFLHFAITLLNISKITPAQMEESFKYFLNRALNANEQQIRELLTLTGAHLLDADTNGRGVLISKVFDQINYRNFKFHTELLENGFENDLHKQAWTELSRLNKELTRVNDGKGLGHYLTSLFAPHIRSIKSQEGLGLFIKLLWRTTIQLRTYEDKHINNIAERELFEITRDIDTKMQLIPFAHQVDDNFINDFVNEENLPTLRELIKALPAQVSCDENFKDLL